MLKVLIILVLTIYLFYRVASFLFRVVFGGPRSQFFYQSQQRKAPNGNINVDQVPRNKQRKKKGYEGGDYVDFEEVK